MYAWLICAAIFTILNVGMIILMGGFPDLDKQIKMVIQISISLPIAALATMKIYTEILLYIFPDKNAKN